MSNTSDALTDHDLVQFITFTYATKGAIKRFMQLLRSEVKACQNLSGKGYAEEVAERIVATCPREDLLLAFRRLGPIAARMGNAPTEEPGNYPTTEDILKQLGQQRGLRGLINSIAEP